MDPSNASVQRWSSVTRNMSEYAVTTLQGLFTVKGYALLSLLSGVVTEEMTTDVGSVSNFSAQLVLDPGGVGGSVSALAGITNLAGILPTAGYSMSLNLGATSIIISTAGVKYVASGGDRNTMVTDGVLGFYPTTITFASGGTTITGGKVRWTALWQPLSGGASLTPYVS